MKPNILIAIVFMITLIGHSGMQAQDYKVSSYQDVYTEIEGYKSMVIEEGGRLSWSKRFKLDFEFPFFDRRYNYINFDEQSVGDFDDSKDYSIFLMSFGYKYDLAKDTIDIQSDVRYKLTTWDGIRALVIQYTKVRLFSDPSIAIYDSYINFQCWFFENGTIELRFGDINLDNSPVYVKGEGFYLLTNAGPIYSGPFVGLTHPTDLSNSIGVSNPYDSLMITTKIDVLTILPPKGWVIKFENVLVNNKEVSGGKEITLFPNPADNYLIIEGITEGANVAVINQLGHTVQQSQYQDCLNLRGLEKGMYYIHFIHANSWITRKFIKL